MNKTVIGHLTALATVSVWGVTFISTKVLLRSFTPVEILLIRFVMGYLTLLILAPHRFRLQNRKQELYYAAAGLTGVALYYLMENIALTYTMASNVGVIISIAPFFTAILAMFCTKEKEKVHPTFFLGFVVALVGISLISFNGSKMQLNPLGDLLTVGAAFVWAVYSIVLRKINSFGYRTLDNTKRIFLWGLLFMIPAVLCMGFKPDVQKLAEPVNIGNFIFLGVIACAICFVTWNYAAKLLGAVKTNVYIYLDPVITVTVSAIVLKEKITPLILMGMILTLIGLFLSEIRPEKIHKSK
ncbi:MAG: DMT family transporter [Lachnospiraceae bacterium]